MIARQSDGFPLSEGWDPSRQRSGIETRQMRQQANSIISQLSGPRQHHDVGITVNVIGTDPYPNYQF